MTRDSQLRRTYILFFLTAFFWASAFVGIRYSLESYSPGALALLRYVVAALVISIFYFRLPTRIIPTKFEFFLLIFNGIIGFSIYNVALGYGEQTVSAGVASFIVGTMPILITMGAVLFFAERLNLIMQFGFVVSFCGVILIAMAEKNGSHFDIGVLYCLLATFSGAGYALLQKYLVRKFHPIEIVSFAIWGGVIGLLPFSASLVHELAVAPPSMTALVIYLGIFPGALAYAGWAYVLRHLPASQACTLLYLVPFLTIVIEWLFLGTMPVWLSFLGGVVAICGSVIVNMGKFKNSSKC